MGGKVVKACLMMLIDVENGRYNMLLGWCENSKHYVDRS